MKETPKFYLLTGLPFSGKTTLAQELARVKLAYYNSYDKVGMQLKLPVLERPLTDKERIKQVGKHTEIAASYLSKNISVVHDATNPTKERRDMLRAVAERYEAQPITIYVATPYEVTLQRWDEHIPTEEKPKPPRELLEWIHNDFFEPPGPDEEHIIYDGVTDTVPEWIERNATLL